MSTLDGLIWSRCSIALSFPARSHFQRTQIRERWSEGWDERYRSSRTGEERDEEGQEKKERENTQPILRKLYAVLLRPFREQHSEKMKGSARGNWDPREVQQPFRPNTNGVGDRTTTLRRLLIDAARTTVAAIDFSKAFDSVWHPALFHKLISAGLPLYFARWTQSFLSDRRACVVYQNHKSRSFRVRRGVRKRSLLGPVFFSHH